MTADASAPCDLTALRLALFRHGYRPVPISSPARKIPSAGKRPTMKSWQAVCARADASEIERWGREERTSTNTGLLTGELVGVDIDVPIEELASQIKTLADQQLGPTRLIRIGKAPKLLLVYRTGESFTKIATPELFKPDGTKTQVEVLGVGQQFVGFGLHPDTGQPYFWPDTSPLDLPCAALPAVTRDQVHAFIVAAERLLRTAGAEPKAERRSKEQAGQRAARLEAGQRPSRELVEEALSFVPNDDRAYDEWIRIGFALYDALGESGRGLWHSWSATSAKNVPEMTERKWATFANGRDITCGTLFYIAKSNGWRRRGTPRRAEPDPTDDDDDADRPDDRRLLRVNQADLPATARAVAALLGERSDLFDRGLPVRLVADHFRGGLITEALTSDGVVTLVHEAARPWQWHNSRDGSRTKTFVTLPERVASLYLAARQVWGLRPLDGITTAPVLAADGAVRITDGYDAGRRLWCEKLPPFQLPDRPTRAQAVAALALLRRVIRTFPFADSLRTHDLTIGVDVIDGSRTPGVGETIALCMMMTAVARPSLSIAPGLAVVAPAISGAGTGKGLLVRSICALAYGTRPSALTTGGSPEEQEKRIAAVLISAEQVVFLDNLNGQTLKSDTLASAITERPALIRALGKSETVPIMPTALIAATGNGLALSEDLTRRFLTIELDAGCEDPEARPFPGDLIADILRRRGELLGAVLTIWRWGRQEAELPAGQSFGNFSEWARWCRDPLLALGCPDPIEQAMAAKQGDPRRRAIAELFRTWWQAHGNSPVTVAELADVVKECIDPQKRGRQYIAAQIRKLERTRLAGFTLHRIEFQGKWTANKYRLIQISQTAAADHRGRA